jgi:hypothetical protein
MSVGTVARDRLRRIADRVRAIPGRRFGLRPYTVAVRVRSSSGTYVGEGTLTTSTTDILVGGDQPPKVRFLSEEQLALGGFAKGSVEVGPVTPNYPTGGMMIASLMATAATAGQEVHFILTGPLYPSGGNFVLQKTGTDRALRYMLTLSPVGGS